jgi:hypothetical protein
MTIPIVVIAGRLDDDCPDCPAKRLANVPSFEGDCVRCGARCLLSVAASAEAIAAGIPIWCLQCFQERRHPDDVLLQTKSGAEESLWLDREKGENKWQD